MEKIKSGEFFFFNTKSASREPTGWRVGDGSEWGEAETQAERGSLEDGLSGS